VRGYAVETERHALAARCVLVGLCMHDALFGCAGFPAADARKLQYALDACEMPDPFACAERLDPAVVEVCSSCVLHCLVC
jgi:hypothetical protein